MSHLQKVNIIDVSEVAGMIKNGSSLVTGGFVGCGYPEYITVALEKQFVETGTPRDLTLIYAAGQGDGNSRGLNHFGHDGMVKRVIGGHWGLAPSLGKLALENKIEAYNFPQGVISHLFREIAADNPGRVTKVGLQTFVDPRNGGGKLNRRTTEELVELMNISGHEMLFYKAFSLDIALLRGTFSDSFGNISLEREALSSEVLSIAMAVKNSGGKVIVQVEQMVDDYSRDPKNVQIPGIFVDAVVLSNSINHSQTFATQFNKNFIVQGNIDSIKLPVLQNGPRRYIAKRAFQEIIPGSVVNLGIGLPEGVAQIAADEGAIDEMTLTVEPGPIGGVPASGLDFGASTFPHAIIDQPYMFDFYDGGGLDIAFLGMAEADKSGNVNVSRFTGRIAGAGGFINITQNSGVVVFLGTFTAGGLEIDFENGKLNIKKEGKFDKFVENVNHLTFNGEYAFKQKQKVIYITERAVFKLIDSGLELIEIAPGIDLDKDILNHMDFKPKISENLKIMSQEIFI